MAVKPEKADMSRQRILDAAAVLFREKGYAPVSMRAIASAAGMKAGSVYYHFKSKDEIVVAVLNLGIEMVHKAVADAVDSLSPSAGAVQMVGTGIASHLQALFQFSAYTSANVRIYGQVPDDIKQANLQVREEYETLWQHILERAVAQGDVRPEVDLRAFRLLLIGSLNATLEWFDPARGSVDELADRYADILLNGLLVKTGDAG